MEMTKAYDTKVLVSKLKDAGLDVAEDAAADVFKAVMGWLKESAPLSATPIDDLVVGIATPMEGYVMAQIDKIDGEVG